jgi:hypothetical protein
VRHSFALTSNDLSNGLVNGGSIWLETTLVIALSHVSVVAFSLQIGRGYFIRALGKFSLKLGADIWWLTYVLIRDALIILSFIIGLLVFLPATFLDYPMAVPFMPVAVVFFGAALVTKLYYDADDHQNAYRIVTLLVFGGAMLWVSGTIFVTESPLFLTVLPPGLSATNGLWHSMYLTFSSQNNLSLAMSSFEVCLPCLVVIGIVGLLHSLFHWVPRPSKKTPMETIYSTSLHLSNQTARAHSGNDPAKNQSFYDRYLNDLNSRMKKQSQDKQRTNRPDYLG